MKEALQKKLHADVYICNLIQGWLQAKCVRVCTCMCDACVVIIYSDVRLYGDTICFQGQV